MFLLIDKPAGITSHDVVDQVRRITGERRVGHAGTLDPFATGLMIVGVGRESTKRLGEFLKQAKTYEATFRIGETTETLDPEGGVITGSFVKVTPTEIQAGISALTGAIMQIPPMYSALKRGGKKLYELARAGETVVLEPRPVTIFELAIIDQALCDQTQANLTPFNLRVRIHCSSGTYIRCLARDLGEKLGTLGYVTELCRTRIGNWDLKKTSKLSELTRENWVDRATANLLN